MRRLPARIAAGAAVIAVGAGLPAGCGGGPAYVRERDATLRLTLDEYRITPENLEVPAGRVRIVAHNVGRLTHNVTIEQFAPAPGEEPKVYGRTATLHPGQTGAELAPIVLRPGKYRLSCSIANHDDLGQHGELKVTAR